MAHQLNLLNLEVQFELHTILVKGNVAMIRRMRINQERLYWTSWSSTRKTLHHHPRETPFSSALKYYSESGAMRI